MMQYETLAPIQCHQCGQVAAYANEEGYRCEECNFLLNWSFFKINKLKCGCETCKKDLEKEFWQKIPPLDLQQNFKDFQI